MSFKVKAFAVTAMCGHVGYQHFTPVTFPVKAKDEEEAKEIVRSYPRVKHNDPFAIINVEEICWKEFSVLYRENDKNPYLKAKSKEDTKQLHLEVYKNPVTKNVRFKRCPFIPKGKSEGKKPYDFFDWKAETREELEETCILYACR